MFGWLRKRWSGNESSRIDTFFPTSRVLYRYFDGQKLVTADPLVLYKNFIRHSSKLTVPLKETGANPLESDGLAYERLLVQLRELFSVKTLEEGGLSDLEVLKLFDHFLAFCGSTVNRAKEEAKQEEATPPPLSPQPETSLPHLAPTNGTTPHTAPEAPITTASTCDPVNLDEIPKPTDD